MASVSSDTMKLKANELFQTMVRGHMDSLHIPSQNPARFYPYLDGEEEKGTRMESLINVVSNKNNFYSMCKKFNSPRYIEGKADDADLRYFATC